MKGPTLTSKTKQKKRQPKEGGRKRMGPVECSERFLGVYKIMNCGSYYKPLAMVFVLRVTSLQVMV